MNDRTTHEIQTTKINHKLEVKKLLDENARDKLVLNLFNIMQGKNINTNK